jgi:hypothetical protein
MESQQYSRLYSFQEVFNYTGIHIGGNKSDNVCLISDKPFNDVRRDDPKIIEALKIFANFIHTNDALNNYDKYFNNYTNKSKTKEQLNVELEIKDNITKAQNAMTSIKNLTHYRISPWPS